VDLYDTVKAALADFDIDMAALAEREPDAALGNGGLGRLAACFMESLATLGCPAYGYGIRYEHGLFRQSFAEGRQMESPEDWLEQPFVWQFERPEARFVLGLGGRVATRDGRAVWEPESFVQSEAYDIPVIGWRGAWANTLRLWAGRAVDPFDLARFNAGDFAAAAEAEALARTISRVLYPGLPQHPGHDIAARQMQDGFGYMLSVQVAGGEAAAIRTAANVGLYKRATSLGGVESLIEHRASIEGEGSPCPPDLLRLSTGLEDVDDLYADMDRALRAAHG